MMSKAELARKAGLSALTIDRLEAGRPCRLDTRWVSESETRTASSEPSARLSLRTPHLTASTRSSRARARPVGRIPA